MKEKITLFLTAGPIQWLCRLILGGVFIYASIDKIVHPHAFAKIMYNYRLLPDILVYICALTLPWVEMFCGIFTVTHIFRRTAVIALTILLGLFIVAISINLLRGLHFDCGCFSAVATGGEKSDPVGLLIRDILILIPAVVILVWGNKPKIQAVESDPKQP